MTKVIYIPGEWRITITGHAGSAPKGEDLVCAGVSALGFALLRAAESYDADTLADEKSAVIDVRCRPGPMQQGACLAMLDAIAGGFELIAEEYPAFVSFERRS